MCSSVFLCLAPPFPLHIIFLLLIRIAAGKCGWPSVQSIGLVPAESQNLRISDYTIEAFSKIQLGPKEKTTSLGSLISIDP